MSIPLVHVGPERIDVMALQAAVRSDADGAVLLFTGLVRNHNEGRAVHHLEYQAYDAMAERELAAIVEEARSRWQVGRVGIHHRTGRLGIGDPSVAIAVASPHRAEAYEVSRYLIEELKRRVPVWKREGYADGSTEWVRGCLHEAAHDHG